MITVATVENALKNIYLDTVAKELNVKTHPLLTTLANKVKSCSGKDAVRGDKKAEIENLYAQFTITDKALKAADLAPNAFTSLLSVEMQHCLENGQRAFKEFLYRKIDELKEVTSESFDDFFDNDFDLILCHSNVRRDLFENKNKDNKYIIECVDLQGGFRGFTVNGMPLYAETKRKYFTGYTDGIEQPIYAELPKDEVYFVNTKKLDLYRLCDWEWLLNDKGAILRQLSTKPQHTATLVCYATILGDSGAIKAVKCDLGGGE